MALQPYSEIATSIKVFVCNIFFSKQMQTSFNSNKNEKKKYVKVVDSLHIL